MSRKVHDKEFESVFALPPARRYEHFIKRVVDWGEVWSLGCEQGWGLGADDEGHELVPVWPHERYAAACIAGDWARYQPRAISLEDWLEKWTPGMERDGRLVAVFPTPDRQSTPVEPQRLRQDLERELMRYG
jgi:uncharacterized protein DUF2750